MALDPVLLAEAAGLRLDPWQRDLVRSDARQVLMNCCRQSGKSTTAALMAVQEALFRAPALVLLVAPTQRQAAELFRKCKAIVAAAGSEAVGGVERETMLALEFASGSRIVTLPGKEATVRGFSAVSLAVIDEASRVPDDLYRGALRPMLAVSQGRLVALSTPWGQLGWFHEEWALGGDAWHRVKVTSHFNPFTFSAPPAAQATHYQSGGSRYVCGVDLGTLVDYTAIAVLERHQPTREVVQTLTDSRNHEWTRRVTEVSPVEYHCGHPERLPLGTSYPDVVRHMKALLETPPLRQETTLVVDATGVGVAVVQSLREAGLRPVAITITGGDSVTLAGGGLRVPKRDLVAVLTVLLQSQRLKIARELEHTPTLVSELLNFKMKIDPVTAHDSYSAWREGAHDDLVLALAVACWYGERYNPTPVIPSRSYVSFS